MSGTVRGLWRYPVKSMQGEALDAADLGERGIPGDRSWGVVDAATGKVLSAKREGRLLESAARFEGEGVVVSLPDGTELPAGDTALDAAASAWLERDVRVERADEARPTTYEMNVDGTDPDSPLVDFPCPPGTFFDAAAVHLLTDQSLAAAAALYPEGAWDRRRFRPTMLVSAGGEGFVEDEWVGTPLAVGGAVLMPFAPTVRCAMTTRAQGELPRDLDILKTMHREHMSNLGLYLAVTQPGPVAVGDPVGNAAGDAPGDAPGDAAPT